MITCTLWGVWIEVKLEGEAHVKQEQVSIHSLRLGEVK